MLSVTEGIYVRYRIFNFLFLRADQKSLLNVLAEFENVSPVGRSFYKRNDRQS